MDAPRLTFRSPTLSVPYFSLDGAMPKQLSDQILSGAEDGGPLHKALRCVAWNPPPDSLARVKTNGTVFAFDVKFEDASLGLAWVKSDTAVVKDRLLGRDHSASLDVLTEFFRDAFELQEEGGIIVAHNLRWKAIVLEAQFDRYGLGNLVPCWRTLTQRMGLCLMSPDIGVWLGVPDGEFKAFRTSLGDICQSVGLNYEPESTTREGALLYLDILKLLRRLAIPPCARGEAPHDFCVWHECAMRDNGEMVSAVCRLCGHQS